MSQSNCLSKLIEFSSSIIYLIVPHDKKNLFSEIDSEVKRFEAPFKL
tara:strand:+ start:54 stop:194 length:141 start_codon:yes stop_codon:yes gene_type:complete